MCYQKSDAAMGWDLSFAMGSMACMSLQDPTTGYAVSGPAPTPQLERLMARDSSSREAAQARVGAQMPVAQKAQMADIIIDNNAGRQQLQGRVSGAGTGLQQPREALQASAHASARSAAPASSDVLP